MDRVVSAVCPLVLLVQQFVVATGGALSLILSSDELSMALYSGIKQHIYGNATRVMPLNASVMTTPTRLSS